MCCQVHQKDVFLMFPRIQVVPGRLMLRINMTRLCPEEKKKKRFHPTTYGLSFLLFKCQHLKEFGSLALQGSPNSLKPLYLLLPIQGSRKLIWAEECLKRKRFFLQVSDILNYTCVRIPQHFSSQISNVQLVTHATFFTF